MSMVIGTNISSLTAQRHLSASKNDMDNAMERLASGSRINSSRDDAAGMAIAGRMTSQISGLNQGIRNANDGIALAQSAEGALDETTSILQRMRDLSVQASSDTLTNSDRESIQSEITALTSEIDRISSTTTFNNKNLLDGSATGLKIQIGASQGETVSISIVDASSATLGISSGATAISSSVSGGRMTTMNGISGNDVQINGVDWIENQNTPVGANASVNDSEGNTQTALTSTAAGVATIINSGTAAHGATATASNLVIGAAATGVTAGTLSINSVVISASNSLNELAANINNEATNAKARVVDGTHIELYNDTGENIVIDNAAITGSGFTINTSNIGFLKMENVDGSKTLLTRGDNTSSTTADVNALGFNERSSASTMNGSSVTGTSGNLALTDDITINGVAIGPSTSNGANISAAALATHLNTFSDDTKVAATAATEVSIGFLTTESATATTKFSTAGNMTVNGAVAGLATTDTLAAGVVKLNTALAAAGSDVLASEEDGQIKLFSGQGTTIAVQFSAINMGISSTTGDGSTLVGGAATRVAGTSFGTGSESYTGAISLTNTAGGDIAFGSVNGSESELTASLLLLGFSEQGGNSVTDTSTALSMSTSSSAAAAVTAIDAALEKVFASRGDLGAFQNRLDHTVSNLRNVSENTAFSKSQIMDTDFATESANLAKAQVLQQAGTAMLAQANASGQSVLSLLK